MREKSFETVALGVAVDPGSAYHGYFLIGSDAGYSTSS